MLLDRDVRYYKLLVRLYFLWLVLPEFLQDDLNILIALFNDRLLRLNGRNIRAERDLLGALFNDRLLRLNGRKIREERDLFNYRWLLLYYFYGQL